MTTARFASIAGHIARAMALVQEHKEEHSDVTGNIKCPKCNSNLRFTVKPSGYSRGQCSARECIRWDQ